MEREGRVYNGTMDNEEEMFLSGSLLQHPDCTSNNALYMVRTMKHGNRKSLTDLWRVLRRVRALYGTAKYSSAHLISFQKDKYVSEA
jgi:hypothetical protein